MIGELKDILMRNDKDYSYNFENNQNKYPIINIE